MGKRDVAVRQRTQFFCIRTNVCISVHYIPECEMGAYGAGPAPRSCVAPSDGVPQFAQPPHRRAAGLPVRPATYFIATNSLQLISK